MAGIRGTLSELSWTWIGRLSALIGIPAGLIAIFALFYQPDNGDCERIALQRTQANGELDRAQIQLRGALSQVAKQEELVAYLASYLDRVTISGDALEMRRVELDRELRQLSVFRDRAATVEDRTADRQSDLDRLDAEFRAASCSAE